MEKKTDVTALGELLIDFTESGVSPQGNLLLEANPGGAPCNVLAMLAKLGHSACFIGRVGKDMFGDLLEQALHDVGIGTEGLKKDEEVHTTLAFVHTGADGDRDFSFYRNPGADMRLCAQDIDPELIRDSRIFHFGTLSMTHESCREATKLAVKTAKDAGCMISFDPNIREPLWDDLEHAREQTAYGISKCDILKISDNEILWFTGETEYDRAIDVLLDRYPVPLLLLSLGAQGSMAVSSGHRVFVPAFRNPATIETTGAGDTFGACVLHYVLEHGCALPDSEEQLKEMLTFANAAASIVTTRKGALKVMPDRAEIEHLLNTMQQC